MCFQTHAQNELTYKKVVNDIDKNASSLIFNLIVPNNDFSIGIYPKDWDVEDLSFEQCGDIKTDINKNQKILQSLKSKKLLDSLFIYTESNVYESLISSDKFNIEQTSLLIEVGLYNDPQGLNYVYIPIFTRKCSKKVLKDISKIFEANLCFRKLIRILK